jgi:hypothetical protein
MIKPFMCNYTINNSKRPKSGVHSVLAVDKEDAEQTAKCEIASLEEVEKNQISITNIR